MTTNGNAPKDVEYHHPTDVYRVVPCRNNEALDLVAVGGEHSVDVVQVRVGEGWKVQECVRVASFHVGSRVTALAWSSRAVSPGEGEWEGEERWFVELTAATADYSLHLLTKSSTTPEEIFSFGGGLSGHHGCVNDMTFCGGWDEDSARYVGTVSDDKFLMVWDLYPSGLDRSSPLSVSDDGVSPPPRAQPTAYVIPFPHPLRSIRSHPGTSKEFLVSDTHGSVFLTDWRTDPEEGGGDGALRHSSVVELIEPGAMAASTMGVSRGQAVGGSVDWRVDAIDIVGGVYGSKFALWDISKLRGGLPSVSGNTFAEGGGVFRWCPTYPDHFAISASGTGSNGALIHIHNCTYIHTPPWPLLVRPKPNFIRDFDFLSMRGIPRVVAAIGRVVVVFSIGVAS